MPNPIVPGQWGAWLVHPLPKRKTRGRVRSPIGGTHDELVERGGTYAALWAIQVGAEPPA